MFEDSEGDPIGNLSMLVQLYYARESNAVFRPFLTALHASRVACLQMRHVVLIAQRAGDQNAIDASQGPVLEGYMAMINAWIPFELACNAAMAELFAPPLSAKGPRV